MPFLPTPLSTSARYKPDRVTDLVTVLWWWSFEWSESVFVYWYSALRNSAACLLHAHRRLGRTYCEPEAYSLNLRCSTRRGQSELTLSVAALRHTARVVAAASVKARCLMNALWQLSYACPECKLCLWLVNVNTVRLEGFLFLRNLLVGS